MGSFVMGSFSKKISPFLIGSIFASNIVIPVEHLVDARNRTCSYFPFT